MGYGEITQFRSNVRCFRPPLFYEGESSLIFTSAERMCQVNIDTVQIFALGKGKVEHDIENSFDNTDLLNLGGILKKIESRRKKWAKKKYKLKKRPAKK